GNILRNVSHHGTAPYRLVAVCVVDDIIRTLDDTRMNDRRGRAVAFQVVNVEDVPFLIHDAAHCGANFLGAVITAGSLNSGEQPHRLVISVGCNDHGLAAEFRLEGFLEFGNTGRVAVPSAAFKVGSDKGVPAPETRRLFRTAGDLEDER